MSKKRCFGLLMLVVCLVGVGYGILKFTRPKTVHNGYFVNPVYVEDLEAMTEESIIYPLVKNESDSGNPIILLYK